MQCSHRVPTLFPLCLPTGVGGKPARLQGGDNCRHGLFCKVGLGILGFWFGEAFQRLLRLDLVGPTAVCPDIPHPVTLGVTRIVDEFPSLTGVAYGG